MQNLHRLKQSVEPLPNITHEALIARLRAENLLWRVVAIVGCSYGLLMTAAAILGLSRVWL